MKTQRYAWMLVVLLWVVALLNYLDRQIVFSVFPLLEAEFNPSSLQLGLLGTVFLWVYAIMSPISGFLGDRFGRRNVIVVSLIVWSSVTWATAHATDFLYLLWTRALMGISEACYIPAALALIADYHGGRTRSLATGIHQSGIYAGIVLGGLGGGWLGEHYGWRFAFSLLGVTGVLYVPVLLCSLKDAETGNGFDIHPQGEGRLLASLKEIMSLPGFFTMAGVFMATSIGGWVVFTWMPLYLYERFHMSLTESGFSATFYMQAGSVGGILWGGWLADRWSRRTRRGRLLTQGAGLMLASPFLFIAGLTSSQQILVLSLLCFGFGRGIYDCNTMPVLCQVARPALRATGYGLFNFVGTLAGGTMAAGAGLIKTTMGLGGALQMSAVILLASSILLLRLNLPKEGDRD